jgi:WD40 repeat protein
VCSSDGLVRGHSESDRKPALTFQQAPDWIYCLSVDAPHNRVAGGCYNGEVLVWDLESGKIMSRFLSAPGLSAGKANMNR